MASLLRLSAHATFCFGLLFTSCSTAQPEVADSLFLEAYRNPSLAIPDDPLLRLHPLSDYLIAQRLAANFADSASESEPEVLAFLADSENEPVGTELRSKLLAQKALNNDWAGYIALYREATADDKQRCQHLTARIALGQMADFAKASRTRFLDGTLSPNNCPQEWRWILDQAMLSAADWQQRFDSALTAGKSNSVSAELGFAPVSPELSARYRLWLRLLSNPGAEVSTLINNPSIAVDAAALEAAVASLARKSADNTADLVERLIEARGIDAVSSGRLRNLVALSYAWSRDPSTVAAFEAIPAAALDERGFEWRVRAALWQGRWPLALQWITEMPSALAEQPRWRYWQARALAATGQVAPANTLFKNLTKEFDTYGLFAAWRLEQGYIPPETPIPLTSARRAALAANPAFSRAEAAWRLGLSRIASQEWRAAENTLAPEFKSALLPKATEWGWYDQAIVTGTRQKIFNAIAPLYPRPYQDLVTQAGQVANLDTPWIYGVMRKESAFRADARSAADAIGLLQLLPSTAVLVARRHGLPRPSREDLFNPIINLPLGALHIKELVEKNQGKYIMSLAGYNAGPNAAKRWLPPAPMDADIWIENIPFNETRIYIQRILLHVAIYSWQEYQKPVYANEWLPTMTPAEEQ